MRTEDGYVISKCLNGEPEAFGFLMDKYKGSVYAFAYSKLRNFHDAEDVTQEVFIKAYGKLRSLRRWDNFLAWLYAITSNMCKNWIRFKANRPDSEFVEDQNAEILMQPSLSSYREDRIDETLREALDSLPETQRQVLTLHYLGGMNGKEIARFLGISPGAVWERLSRARAQLREEMLEMMSTTLEAQKLRAGFTMRMVEIVKRIKIHPMPKMAGLPWGMSLAAGIIIAILSVGTHLNLTNTEPYASVSLLSGESMVQEVGEFPVDVMKMSDMTITSDQHLLGNGLGNVVPDLQNALFMAPQAEGGTWTKKADILTRRFALSTSVVNGKIYAIGGSGSLLADPEVHFSTVEEYDPLTDTWTKKTDMPTPRGWLSSSEVNGKICAIGGWNNNGTALASVVEEYDPGSTGEGIDFKGKLPTTWGEVRTH